MDGLLNNFKVHCKRCKNLLLLREIYFNVDSDEVNKRRTRADSNFLKLFYKLTELKMRGIALTTFVCLFFLY